MHLLRLAALRTRQQIRVQAQLQYGASLGFSCELGIDNFVRPVAERTASGNANEHIGATAPNALQECALDDDLDPLAHCSHRLLDLRRRDSDTFDLDDLHPPCTQVLDVRALVCRTALPQHLQRWIPDLRLRPAAGRNQRVEVRQVMAVEIADQIRSAELNRVAKIEQKRFSG
jgi:hypothetical protein